MHASTRPLYHAWFEVVDPVQYWDPSMSSLESGETSRSYYENGNESESIACDRVPYQTRLLQALLQVLVMYESMEDT